jgi:hypothetical protein
MSCGCYDIPPIATTVSVLVTGVTSMTISCNNVPDTTAMDGGRAKRLLSNRSSAISRQELLTKTCSRARYLA